MAIKIILTDTMSRKEVLRMRISITTQRADLDEGIYMGELVDVAL